ncbi:MAG: cytidylate kinase-like family protein, partial [Syntrophorhabdaceae bacterium]|nr:cytidylate kinase-like family protein [Syntrophorhabdaceae bacterium]
GMTEDEAITYVKKEDEAKSRYIKDNFGEDINNPLLYHLIINTDLISHEEAARLIGDTVIKRFKLDVPEKRTFKKEVRFVDKEVRL